MRHSAQNLTDSGGVLDDLLLLQHRGVPLTIEALEELGIHALTA